MFLKRNGDTYYCSIYKNKLESCRKYPFFTGNEKLKDCLPKYFLKPEPLENLVPDYE
jgi:Fe-S-cluster containining protein